MNSDQEIDYAYHADRLRLRIAQRDKLPADSDLVPALNIEISAIEDLRITPSCRATRCP
jgi:hypothetical protein